MDEPDPRRPDGWGDCEECGSEDVGVWNEGGRVMCLFCLRGD